MGEIVSGMEVLDKIYTGYGEKGPSQKILRHEGASDAVRNKWPSMDYIQSCKIVDHS
jgi:hypothetical protein